MFRAEDLKLIRDLIYRETGMFFEEKKDYYLGSRITNRMTATGVSNFKDYYNSLLFEPQKVELKAFIEAITINETYFFRDYPQLQGFADYVLDKMAESKRVSRKKTLKIWSAACSTGEEPYTLAIILRECLDDFADWNIEILATDIDSQVLQKARQGIYSQRSIKDMPMAYRQKYLKPRNDAFELSPDIRKMVTFKELNLMDRISMRSLREFDFIFCRNVLIYFDDDSRKKVMASLYDGLRAGGYLFLGHSESVGRITAAFELEKMGDFLCYRRP